MILFEGWLMNYSPSSVAMDQGNKNKRLYPKWSPWKWQWILKKNTSPQFSWRRGSKESRSQGFKGLFSKDFIRDFNLLSISAMSFFSGPKSFFSIKSKSQLIISVFPIRKQSYKIFNSLAFLSAYFVAGHPNPWILGSLNPLGSQWLHLRWHTYFSLINNN